MSRDIELHSIGSSSDRSQSIASFQNVVARSFTSQNNDGDDNRRDKKQQACIRETSTSSSCSEYGEVRNGISYDEETPEQLNEMLETNFELGDAIRLETNNNEVKIEDDIDDYSAISKSDIESCPPNRHEDTASCTLTLNKVFTNKTTGEIELPPDKGYAWVAVFAVFLVMFNSWGCNSAFGVFLSHFLSNGTFKGATKYDYALIAGFPVALGQGMAPLSLILMRIIGLRQTMMLGTVIMLVGFIWASFATQLWELYVSQGVFIGTSIALIANPPTTTLPGWFLKKRAVAMGLSLLGTGLGGMTYGLACNKMISDNGNTNWCYRMLAITCTGSTVISIILIRERTPAKPVGVKSTKAMWGECTKFFNGEIVRRPTVLLIASWFNMAIFAYTLMIFTLASYAVARGMTQHQGSILTSILNAAQAVGRPTMGLMGDRFGRINVTSALTCILCIYIFAFWIPANTFIQLIFFSIMVGSCVGVANVMNAVLIADMVKPHEFLPAWGFVTYSGAPLFLVCELIAQALTVPTNKSNPYLHTQIFAGCVFFVALILSLFLRERAIRIRLQEEKLSLSKKTDADVPNSVPIGDDGISLKKRQENYDYLLGTGFKKFLLRMAYRAKI